MNPYAKNTLTALGALVAILAPSYGQASWFVPFSVAVAVLLGIFHVTPITPLPVAEEDDPLTAPSAAHPAARALAAEAAGSIKPTTGAA